MSLVGHQVMSSTEPSTSWSSVEFNPVPKSQPGILIICLCHVGLSAFQAAFLMWVSGIWHNQASS